jgi:hypothetical protein
MSARPQFDLLAIAFSALALHSAAVDTTAGHGHNNLPEGPRQRTLGDRGTETIYTPSKPIGRKCVTAWSEPASESYYFAATIGSGTADPSALGSDAA